MSKMTTQHDKVEILWAALWVWIACGWILGGIMIYQEFFK